MNQQRPGLILALVSLPIFIGALDLTIISAVLPAVIADLKLPLQTGLDDAAWAVTGYLLAYAVSMTFMGRVSDVWGRRRVYLTCLTIFFLGSWLVAASSDAPAQLASRLARLLVGGRPDRSLMALYALVFGRVVQAFGAGAMVPVSMALVADLYPPERRALPLGIVGAVDTAGWVLGHLYGGIMVQFLPWPFLFWINLPIVAIMFGLTAWALRGLSPGRPGGRIDWIGAVLTAVTLVGLNLGLGARDTTGGGQTLPPRYALPALIVGVIGLLLFLWAERRIDQPLFNLRIFANRNVSSASAMNLLVGFCLMVGLVSVPLFINIAGAQTSGQGALVSGYLLATFTVPMALAAIPGGFLAERLGYRWSSAIGMMVALGGFGLMSQWEAVMAQQAVAFVSQWDQASSESVAGILRMAAGLLVAGVGLGLTIAPIGTAAINGVAETERGMAAALVIVLRLIGMSISVSTLTAYGLQRSTSLSQTLMQGVSLSEAAKIAELTAQVATRVTIEMSVIAAAVCGVAIVPALLLHHRDIAVHAQPSA